jgi:hypothetical protein
MIFSQRPIYGRPITRKNQNTDTFEFGYQILAAILFCTDIGLTSYSTVVRISNIH